VRKGGKYEFRSITAKILAIRLENNTFADKTAAGDEAVKVV
jgi:hypothetical protein